MTAVTMPLDRVTVGGLALVLKMRVTAGPEPLPPPGRLAHADMPENSQPQSAIRLVATKHKGFMRVACKLTHWTQPAHNKF